MDYAFRIVNVFTVGDDPLSGNPLCVFEDARGLTDEQMQALARQMNLSETTFVLPPRGDADAHVRNFTPTFEMPFAGHPTLGTASVVAAARETGARAGPLLTQGAFLRALGIEARAQALATARPDRADQVARQLDRLVGEAQMGALFKVACLCAPGLSPPLFEDAT